MDSEFEKILAENAGILHKLCRVYTFSPDEYQELFQEMLVQIWRSRDSFRGGSKISTWIYRICINTALGLRSKLAREKRRFEALDGQDIVQNNLADLHNERLQQVYAAIRELKPIDRALVSLYLDEKPHDEIASILGISKTNVSTRLMRLKKVLAEKISQ